MKKMQFYVPEPMIRQLDAIAKVRDVTRAEVVRGALGKYLEGVWKIMSLDEFAGRMQGGESRYVPGKGVTYVEPIRVTLPGGMTYDFYAEWDVPGIEDHYGEDGDLTDDGYALMRQTDERQVQAAYEAYKKGYAYYIDVEGVGSKYDSIKGEDIAE